jgi:hypothetical protein
MRHTPTRILFIEDEPAIRDAVTFLGERYRRLVKRRGKLRALVAVARTILVIIWHLLADPAARYHDLGAGYYASRIDTDKKARSHIRQLEARAPAEVDDFGVDPQSRPRLACTFGRSACRGPYFSVAFTDHAQQANN